MSGDFTTLANGLRIVTLPMGHLETTSLGVWVGTGSRNEGLTEHGISHVLEHMAFKGTHTRSAQDIAEEIEAVGGELNAATGVETTAYYARVLKGDEGVALGLLADILLDPALRPNEVDREKEVILQEIAALADSPDDIVFDLLQDAAFPEQPVGRPIIGTPDSVKGFSAKEIQTFLKTHYQPRNMVIAVAGNVRHDEIVRHAEALFGGLTSREGEYGPAAAYAGGCRSLSKPFEQSHLVVGFEGPSYCSDGYYTAQVFSGLFGGGMSSRLFQEVREKRGLCYSIYSSAWGLRDSGMFMVHAATNAKMMPPLIDVVGTELCRVAETGPGAAELSRAKAQLKSGLMMALESSGARAEQAARQLLAHGRIIPSAELIARVDAVYADEVREFAAGLLSSPPSVAVVGAGQRSQGLAQRAARCFRA